MGIYRVLVSTFAPGKWPVLVGVFLVPSTIFWCSGIHKDGLILSSLGLIIYVTNKALVQGFKYKYLALGLFCLVFIFLLRNYIAIALIPAIVCWCLAHNNSAIRKWIFPLVYVTGVALFFILPYFEQSLNFPAFIAIKNQEFRLLAGGSSIDTPVLQPDVAGFARYLPTALDIAFLRPHYSEIHSPAALLAFIEIVFSFLILVTYILFPVTGNNKAPLTAFLLFFSISVLIIAGYTITLSGAIVRYRSVVLPLLLSPILSMIDWQKIRTKFHI